MSSVGLKWGLVARPAADRWMLSWLWLPVHRQGTNGRTWTPIWWPNLWNVSGLPGGSWSFYQYQQSRRWRAGWSLIETSRFFLITRFSFWSLGPKWQLYLFSVFFIIMIFNIFAHAWKNSGSEPPTTKAAPIWGIFKKRKIHFTCLESQSSEISSCLWKRQRSHMSG